MKSISVQILKWCLGCCLFLTGDLAMAAEPVADAYFQERVNLALREIAHRMLSLNGDSTTAVPPVSSEDGRQFVVRFDGDLRYDTLRAIVDQTLSAAGLPLRYDLAVYDCLGETMLLGFVARPENAAEGYPCQDRDAAVACVDIALRFPGQRHQSSAHAGWLAGVSILFGLIFIGWRRGYRETPLTPAEEEGLATLQIGNTQLNEKELIVTVGEKEKTLTYREAKLLRYFISHPNEVLPREQILEAVWGEEGVQVTRSLDVFVSRLRKILKEDPHVQIASVHGVGYRLVISDEPPGAVKGGLGFPNSILDKFQFQ